jgi:hypothetical protein
VNRENIITGNAFKSIADDFLDEEKTFLDLSKKPKIIFLKTDWIELFKNKILPKINYQFSLITHNADRSCPSGNFDLLEDNKLIKWFGMNCDITHPKLQPIPIGIANEKWSHGNKDILLKIINENNEKKNFVYSNFDVSTNYNKRNNTLNWIKTQTYIDQERSKLSFENYLKKLSTYKYVISPAGNSIDCHRIWESIYLNVIPIIEKHVALEFFYDLTILVVDSFEQITEKMLNDEFIKIKSKNKQLSDFIFYKKMIRYEKN